MRLTQQWNPERKGIYVLSANAFLRKGYTSHTSVETVEIESPTYLLLLPVIPCPMDISEIMDESGPTTTTHNVDLDAEDEDDENIISESLKYCNVETMKYVVGSIIRRLNAEHAPCAEHLASLKSKDECEGFPSMMTS